MPSERSEDADDHHLAPRDADGRDPEVDRLLVEPEIEAAVLGAASLGDVHVGQYLDPRQHRVVQAYGNLGHFLENAVEPKQYPA